MSCRDSHCMDPRCPRRLKCLPDTWCELAVLKLKALRNVGKELTEEEEGRLPGCPFFIHHQSSCYCFFKFLADYLPEKTPSDVEMAHLLGVSPETVHKITSSAINKLKGSGMCQELGQVYAKGSIFSDSSGDDPSDL